MAAPEPVTVPPADDPRWKQVAELPCTVAVQVPVGEFTVQDLLGLRVKSVVRSQRSTTAPLPLRVNGELVATCEFEVLGNRLSVRVLEIA